MAFNRAFFLRKEDRDPQWVVIDAEGKVLGRLATQIADILRGKNKPTYTPHADAGDYVVVINVDKIVMTGNKMRDKIYAHYTGWIGGYKEQTAEQLNAKHPTDLLMLAVKRMLPKNTLNRAILKKLKIYVGAEHPHIAQVSTSQAAQEAAKNL
jgi:large subunit ribosomal protein L13